MSLGRIYTGGIEEMIALGNCMQVHNAKVTFVLTLELEPLLDRSYVVPYV